MSLNAQKSVTLTLHEYGTWNFEGSYLGDSASMEWGSSDNNGNAQVILTGKTSEFTVFTFTNDMNDESVQLLVYVK